MSDPTYHEPFELLSEPTRNMHRAITTLIEELEAIDWYDQRAEACSDPELQAIIRHNQREEIEHAMMTLEWIRRHNPQVEDAARRFLNTSGAITGLEHEANSAPVDGAPEVSPMASLGIGSLRSVRVAPAAAPSRKNGATWTS